MATEEKLGKQRRRKRAAKPRTPTEREKLIDYLSDAQDIHEVMKTMDPASVVRESQEAFLGGTLASFTAVEKLAGLGQEKERVSRELSEARATTALRNTPRAKGSESSYAFESRDQSGRKTTRYSNKPKPRRGEKRKRSK